MVIVAFCIVSVALVILALQGAAAGSWTTVAQEVTPMLGACIILALVIIGVVEVKK